MWNVSLPIPHYLYILSYPQDNLLLSGSNNTKAPIYSSVIQKPAVNEVVMIVTPGKNPHVTSLNCNMIKGRQQMIAPGDTAA